MEDSIILSTPLVLVLLTVAVLLSLYNTVKRPKTFVIALIAVLIVIIALTVAVLLGAKLQEILITLLIFGLISIAGFVPRDKGGKDEEDGDGI